MCCSACSFSPFTNWIYPFLCWRFYYVEINMFEILALNFYQTKNKSYARSHWEISLKRSVHLWRLSLPQLWLVHGVLSDESRAVTPHQSSRIDKRIIGEWILLIIPAVLIYWTTIRGSALIQLQWGCQYKLDCTFFFKQSWGDEQQSAGRTGGRYTTAACQNGGEGERRGKCDTCSIYSGWLLLWFTPVFTEKCNKTDKFTVIKAASLNQ